MKKMYYKVANSGFYRHFLQCVFVLKDYSMQTEERQQFMYLPGSCLLFENKFVPSPEPVWLKFSKRFADSRAQILSCEIFPRYKSICT